MNNRTAAVLVVDAITSEKWILETLDIMKLFNEDKLVSRTINTAYITALYLNKFGDKEKIKYDTCVEIIKAVIVKDIGKAVIRKDSKEVLNNTMEYVSARTDNTNISNIIWECLTNMNNKESKIIRVSYMIEDMLESIINNSEIADDKDILEYFNKENKIIVDNWKKGIIRFNSHVDEIREFLNRSISFKTNNQAKPKKMPIEILVEAIMKNRWIIDILMHMKEREDPFLYEHSINTGIHTAFLILFGTNGIFKTKDVCDIVTGSILHDVGYIEREAINHTYHLCMDLSDIEVEICKRHIVYGKSWLLNYLKENNIEVNDTVYEIIEDHHEYEDGSGYLKKRELSNFVKIVNLANAIDLQIYRAKENKNNIAFINCDRNYILISKKFDLYMINNIAEFLLDILNKLSMLFIEYEIEM